MSDQAKRAILYGWDGDPMAEIASTDPQDLSEKIGNEIHQILVFDPSTSEIRVQILDDDGKPLQEWHR